MRSRIVVAVVMFAAAMCVSSFAVADVPPAEDSRATVVGWAYTYQDACRNAYAIADEIAEETNQTYKVYGYRKGKNLFHVPPCWWELQLLFQKKDSSASPQ
ncbi:MAG: hypothetical protein HQ582_27050 [Planctomycetes bacterium]|nr:hypothetical protein [Planctomycetota bacterium]